MMGEPGNTGDAVGEDDESVAMVALRPAACGVQMSAKETLDERFVGVRICCATPTDEELVESEESLKSLESSVSKPRKSISPRHQQRIGLAVIDAAKGARRHEAPHKRLPEDGFRIFPQRCLARAAALAASGESGIFPSER
jgi:hypothetical protein